MKQEKEIDEKRNFFAVFLLFFPTLIIAAIPSTSGSIWLSFALRLLLAFYQFIVVKNFVDKYYGD